MSARVERPSWFGVTLVLTAAALWGTVGPAQVMAGSAASPLALGAARLLVGGLVLSALVPLLHRGRCSLSLLWQRPTVVWLLAAAVSTAAYQAAFLSSVARTGAAVATVVALGVAPPAVGIASRMFAGERLTLPWTIGTVAAITGTTLLLLSGTSSGVDPLGVALGIAGGLCYGVYTVAAKKLLEGEAPTFLAVAVTLLVGGVLLAPAAVDASSALVAPRTLLLVGWLAVPATALGYLLFVRGLGTITAGTAGTLSLAEPLVAAALGIVLLDEHLTPLAAAGAGLLLVGLVAVTIRHREPVTAPIGPGSYPNATGPP